MYLRNESIVFSLVQMSIEHGVDVIAYFKHALDNIVKCSRWSRYLVIDFSHPWPKSTRQRAKCLAPTVLRPARCPERASVCLPQ